jgi:hypothetical protein
MRMAHLCEREVHLLLDQVPCTAAEWEPLSTEEGEAENSKMQADRSQLAIYELDILQLCALWNYLARSYLCFHIALS